MPNPPPKGIKKPPPPPPPPALSATMTMSWNRWKKLESIYEKAKLVLDACFVQEEEGEYISQYYRFEPSVIKPLQEMREAIFELEGKKKQWK